ncbi:MAG: ROK family protein [Candidatus Margulisiibacteriota bacterium]
MKKYLIGVDLGGTKISTAIALNNGRIVYEKTIPTPASQGVKKVIAAIEASIYDVMAACSVSINDVRAIGVGAPGPVVYEKGLILNPPNLKGWKKVPLRNILSRKFKKPVFLENDANAAALAELKFGTGRKFRDFVYVTISTGIGGGIILNKKLFRGSSGFAGELGHMTIDMDGPRCSCGKPGHFEGMACGPALQKITGMRPEELNLLAKAGSKKALKEIEELGKIIGIGFSNLVNIINPQAIVVGGGLSNLGEPLFRSIRKTVLLNALSPADILPAKLKKNTGVLGAIALCL